MTLGETIKEYRLKAGLTQAQLAELTGVDRVTVTRYENGSITPPIKMLKKLADALNVGHFGDFLKPDLDAGKVISFKENGEIEIKERSSEEEKKREKDAQFINRLSVPALKLNDTGRADLLNYADYLTTKSDLIQ